MAKETKREAQIEQARKRAVLTGEAKDFAYYWKMRLER
jgi:hypothetical protein